jgi:enolase
MSSVIQSVQARRIWDSRGRPTVEVEVGLSSGVMGRGIAPAGASRGSREAVDLRDGGPLLGGFDVQKALGHVRDRIRPAILGLPVNDLFAIDQRLMALDRPRGPRSVATPSLRLPLPCLTQRPVIYAYQCGSTLRRAGRCGFPCRRSRSLAGGPMQAVGWIFRIFW